jgi:hypothetical protein
MKCDTQIINITGGPGVGKSTIAAGIYSVLKRSKISCELVQEAAKEITWEQTPKLLENQIHIFSEQFRRQWRLIDKVSYVITDSPLILNSIYYDYYLKKLGYGTDKSQIKFSDNYIEQSRNFFDGTFVEFNNWNFYVTRYFEVVNNDETMIYPTWEAEGRNQTLEEALDIDDQIQSKLAIFDPYYNIVNSTNDTEKVVSDISELLILDYNNNKRKRKQEEVVNEGSVSGVYT